MLYMCGLWIMHSNSLHFKANPFRGNTQLTFQRHWKKINERRHLCFGQSQPTDKSNNSKNVTNLSFHLLPVTIPGQNWFFSVMIIFTNNVNISCVLPVDPALAQSDSSTGNVPRSRASSRVGSNDDDAPTTPPPCIFAAHVSKTSSSTKSLSMLDYPRYMAHLLATEELTPLSSPGASSTETSPTIKVNVSHACR